MRLNKCLFPLQVFVLCLSQGSPPAGSSHRLYMYYTFPHTVHVTGLLQWFLMILQSFASLLFITSVVCPSSIPGVTFLLSCDYQFLLPYKIPVLPERHLYARTVLCMLFSMPEVRRAYNVTVNRHFISFWGVFQTLQYRLRKLLRVKEHIFSSSHHKDHQQARTVVEDYLQKIQPKTHGR